MNTSDALSSSIVGTARLQRLSGRADEWALSSESEAARDAFARIASSGNVGFDALVSAVMNGDVQELKPVWVARLARLVALQATDDESRKFAGDFLSKILELVPSVAGATSFRKLLFELRLFQGDVEGARRLITADPDLAKLYHGYLSADVTNPYVLNPQDVDFSRWLEQFNEPFTDNGLSPVLVARDAKLPFNSLSSSISHKIHDGPLVSVIFTTYKPDPDELETSVRSILQQTWQNLELLLVDDASGSEYDDLLERLASTDQRIKLLRMPANGGTYRARNEGLRVAAGEFMTGQDTDDWSHPERLEVQVATLLANPGAVGVTASANRTDDNLVRAAIGNKPHRRCEVSLMVRVSDARLVGGYLRVRRGADSEFRERIEKWSGRPVVALEEPLYMIRMSPGSLSRSDFRPGWSHHARRAFWSAYTTWHGHVDAHDLVLTSETDTALAQIDIPPRIMGTERTTALIDVCLIADWRGYSPLQRSAMDELRVLLEAGFSVSVLHLDSPFTVPAAPRALIPELQVLINEGKINRLYDDVEDAVELAIVRDPAVLHFGKAGSSALRVGKTLVVCDGCTPKAPIEEQLYDPSRVAEAARQKFGREVSWVSAGPSGCEHPTPNSVQTIASSYPPVVHAKWFHMYHRQRPAARPITIGRAASNSDSEWPRRRASSAAYPVDESVDFRIHGDARGGIRSQRLRQLPVNWLQFRESEISADVFWASLDFVVYFAGDGARSGYGYRSLLEAMAVGTVVATSQEVADTLSGHAIVATPANVHEKLVEFTNSFDAYREIAQRAQQFVRHRYTSRNFVSFVESQMEVLTSKDKKHEA